jgi:DNA modification methylase
MFQFEGYNAELKNTDFFNNDIPDESIDAIVCDPPYGLSYKNTHSTDDGWDDFTDYFEFYVKYLLECKRILKPGASMWTFFAPTMIREVLKAIDVSGLENHLENWSIYARNKGRGANTKLKSLREDVMHLSKGPANTWHSVEYLRRVVVPYVKNGRPRG